MTSYSTIEVEHRGAVGVVTLSRPDALNTQLMGEVTAAVSELDRDGRIGTSC